MLQRWLRMPLSEQDHECPCCDGVLDRFGEVPPPLAPFLPLSGASATPREASRIFGTGTGA